MADINFVDADPEAILSEMIQDYEDAYYQITGENVSLVESDDHMAQVAALAYRLSLFAQLIDKVAKSNLIDYAEGDFLDAIGSRVGKSRGVETASITTLKFTLADAQSEVISIPKGTIVKSKNYFFETDEYVEIAIGEVDCTVIASCMIKGTGSNGIMTGNINTIVSEFNVVLTVTNQTTTQGGTDVQSDVNYRVSIKETPYAFSVAGPVTAYQTLAKQFSKDILDVKASSPSAGVVDICFILNDGELPNQTMIDGLEAYLSDGSRRPLTDHVIVSAPSTVEYSIDCTYFIGRSNADKVDVIKSDAEVALSKYILWQKSKIKRDIDPTELIVMLKSVNVKRCVITSPSYTVVGDTEVASVSQINLVYGGLEDE